MQNIILVIALLLIGFSLRSVADYHAKNPDGAQWLFAVPANIADGLTSFVIYVSLPALIFVQVPRLVLSMDLLVAMIMPWVMLLVSAALVMLVCRLFSWENETKGLLLLLVPLGNTSFLGIPMVQAFFGDGAIQYAVIYDQVGTFLALATYGAVVAAVYGSGSKGDDSVTKKAGPDPVLIIRKIIAFPPFIALVLAFLLRSFDYPLKLVALLGVLSGTLVPLVIVAVAFKMELAVRAEHRKPLGVGLTLKLVVAPLLALAGCRMLGLEGEVVDVSVFEAGMPPQIAAWAVAMKAGLEPELGAAMVGFGILLSFLTLAGLFQLFSI